jgi:hypothetical protein
VKDEGCKVNAMAHPNQPASKAYADAISKILKTAWGPAI